MYFAPSAFRIAACSALRTMFTSATPSAMHSLLSIWPRLDAAAVCTSALCSSRRMVATMPRAVSGLTKAAAACLAVIPSGNGSTSAARSFRWRVYIPPPTAPTTRPMRCPALAPAATTTPPPSLPTGSDFPARRLMNGANWGGIFAVALGRPEDVPAASVFMSAGPNITPMSEGFTGAASIRTTISSGPGVATAASSSVRRSSPSGVTSERSSSVLVMALVI